MPAIRPHSTPVSDAPWDGPANERRLKLDQDFDYYARAYAWRDPEGDESNKSSYRFIHHFVDEDGNPGAASIVACRTAIGVLNGGRGVDVEAQPWYEDREAIYRHLARHLEDAGLEPPPLQDRSRPGGIERRAYQPVEVRVDDGGSSPKIVGHAAVFDQLSEPLGFFGFRERIKPGAFKQTIEEDDIRALWNHNPDWVLGRNRAGTLRLWEDDRGLAVEIIPPDTQWARDLLTSIRRGDVNQMSFGFQVVDEFWAMENGESVRTLQRVRLFDVSVVTFPAYPQTDAAVRASIERLAASIEALQRRLAAPVPSSTNRAGSKIEAARRRLRLLEVD